jgi:hypothetical protein
MKRGKQSKKLLNKVQASNNENTEKTPCFACFLLWDNKGKAAKSPYNP